MGLLLADCDFHTPDFIRVSWALAHNGPTDVLCEDVFDDQGRDYRIF